MNNNKKKKKIILILHGFTMSDVLMRYAMSCIEPILNKNNFECVYINGHLMDKKEVEAFRQFYYNLCVKKGHAAPDWPHIDKSYDWLGSTTNEDGSKSYKYLDESSNIINNAINEKDRDRVVALLGFSQGSILGSIIAGQASRNLLNYKNLKCFILHAGYKSTAKEAQKYYPIVDNTIHALITSGKNDLLADIQKGQDDLVALFPNGCAEKVIFNNLGHNVPKDEQHVNEIVKFLLKYT